MEILKQDLKKGFVKLKISSPDDFWYLTHVLEEKDIIKGKTTRKIKLTKETDRKQTVVKKTAIISLKIEKLDLNPDSIRISGIIVEGPEEFQKGSHHSIELKENSIFSITKPYFFGFQLKRLDEAAKDKSTPILICLLDRENASFYLLKKSKIDLLSEISADVQKKGDDKTKVKENKLYAETAKLLVDYTKKLQIQSIIIASPAFWKEELNKELEKKFPELKEKITLATCSSYGRQAIDEILKRAELKNLLKQQRIAKETTLVERLLTEIAKENLAVYGLEETKNAASLGAIETLLITDEIIKKAKEENKFEELDTLMKLVESTSGEIHLISTEHEAGKKLQGLTGIAAILRYKLY